MQFGKSVLNLFRDRDDWLTWSDKDDTAEADAFHFDAKTTEAPTVDNTSRKRQRWVGNPKQFEISILPSLPDRPLVVRPESELKLLPKCEGFFRINLPLFISLKDPEKKAVIAEIPVYILSNTWFGETVFGQLCYSCPFPAERKQTVEQVLPGTACCRIKIVNASKEILDIQRICLQVQHLKLFTLGPSTAVTSGLIIIFKGADVVSKVTYSKKTDFPECVDPPLLAEERISPSSANSWRSFKTFRQSVVDNFFV